MAEAMTLLILFGGTALFLWFLWSDHRSRFWCDVCNVRCIDERRALMDIYDLPRKVILMDCPSCGKEREVAGRWVSRDAGNRSGQTTSLSPPGF